MQKDWKDCTEFGLVWFGLVWSIVFDTCFFRFSGSMQMGNFNPSLLVSHVWLFSVMISIYFTNRWVITCVQYIDAL
jgi:hypothetical protein